MTKPDPTILDDEPSDGAILFRRALIGIGGGVLLIFLIGMVAGYLAGMLEQMRPDAIDLAIVGATLAAVLGTGFAMWRFWPRSSGEPEAARVKRARSIMIGAMVAGGVFGVFLAAGAGAGGAGAIFTNGPVQPGVALIAITGWLVLMPALTWLWWRAVDEHEATAYREGAFVAAHAYIFIAPAWWVATRAGWLPAQDPMLVMLAVSVIWSAVWLGKRYF